jgi:site-specific recombinase XerD
MAGVNYYLKGALSDQSLDALLKDDPKKVKEYLNTPLQISLKVSMAGSRIQVYTKKRIEPKYWNKNKQEANCKKLKLGCSEINTWLSDLKKEVILKCIQLETSSKKITKPELLQILDQFSVKKSTRKTFDDFIEFFLTEHKTKSGNPLKLGTKKKYRTLINHLNLYCDNNNMQPYVEHVNARFLKGFQHFLRDTLKHTDNTVVKYLKECKTFFNFLHERSFIDQINFSGIKTTETEGEIYTLSIDEIQKIQGMDFKNTKLNSVRDIFCFQCWTGQRISDIVNIRWEDIHTNKEGNKIWNFISIKLEERVIVPIIPQAEQIISKYENDPLPLPIMSTQKINEYLKEIGKLAELDRKVRKVKYYNGELQTEYLPFFKVLTTHVARKSYITNSLILEIPERVVRSISKHKNEKSFRRYVEISEEYKDHKIREAFESI